MRTLTLEQKWRLQVDIGKKNECWVWQGSITNKGYGVLRDNGKIVRAHRVSYLLFTGHIPEDMCVCHSCDNRLCVNPRHLWLGSKADNAKDMWEKGRGVAGFPRNNLTRKPQRTRRTGHPGIKITQKQADKMILEHINGKSLNSLAKKYGISLTLARKLRTEHCTT